MDNFKWAKETLDKTLEKLQVTIPEVGETFPHIAAEKEYKDDGIYSWVSGFWPGILWLSYMHTKNELYKNIAINLEKRLDERLDGFETLDHDAGFIWLLSSGANYMLSCDSASRLRLLKAASHLAGRFNPKGNFIKAWNKQNGYAIIDCMMNLPLLYFASKELDDPRFENIAASHIETVEKYFLRSDGSTNHIVSFDAKNGNFIEAIGGQGAAPDSAWSRGTSWALYGFALAYRHFKNEKYLSISKNVAKFFIENLPDDNVAHWDFRVPRNADTPRDTTAAACAACGMLEISKHLKGEEGKYFENEAVKILKALSDKYSNFDNDCQAILKCGTGNFPKGININVGIIYGDYFYLEALSRLGGNDKIFWYC